MLRKDITQEGGKDWKTEEREGPKYRFPFSFLLSPFTVTVPTGDDRIVSAQHLSPFDAESTNIFILKGFTSVASKYLVLHCIHVEIRLPKAVLSDLIPNCSVLISISEGQPRENVRSACSAANRDPAL